MEYPPSLPSPRVVKSSVLKKRFPKLMTDIPDGDHLLQVWAIAVGQNEQGRHILLTGCAVFGSFDEAQSFVPVPRNVFESWFPLAMLNTVPDDLSRFDTLPAARPERVVVREAINTGCRVIEISADEGYELADKWASGYQPTRRTRAYLKRALAIIPSELAGDFTETYQKLVNKDFDEESPTQIAALCFAIASLLEGPEAA